MTSDEGCCGGFASTFCLDFLNPACSFQQFLRKMAVVQGFAFCIAVAVFIGLFVLEMLVNPNDSVRTVLYLLHLLMTAIPYTIIYAYVRRVGTVTDFVISVHLFVGAVGWLLVSYYSPGRSLTTYGIMNCAITSAMVSMPYMKSLFSLLFVAYVLSTYNYAAVVTREIEPIAAQGWQQPNFIGLFMNGIMGVSFMVTVVVGCVLQARHFLRVLATAEAANELSRTAAALLREYDTDAVGALLEEYREAPDHDADILESYEALVANLNRYRPHLPNWMVRQEGDEDSTRTSVQDESASVRSRRSGARSSAAYRVGAAASAVGSGAGSAAGTSSSLSTNAPLGDAARVVSTVAFALVDFRVGDDFPSQHGNAVSRFIDTLHRVAATTHGAIHTFVGDTVQLSWNAAMKCAQPEVKAARFLARLKVAVEESRDQMTVSAAAMSGKASHQFGGTGRVSALAVSMPWRAELLACFELAKRHRAFVTTSSLAATVNHAVLTRGVEQLSVTDAAGAAHTMVVHEMLTERDDDNDEWMYVLEKGEGGGKVDALHECIEGRYANAIAALDDNAADSPPPSALVSHLRERAEAALVQQASSFAAPGCNCASAM
jgi:hypothetical protein